MLDNQGAGCGGCDESNDEGGEDADEAQVNSDQFLQTMILMVAGQWIR